MNVKAQQLTSLITLEYARDAHEINGHSQLCIRLDVQRLLPCQSRRIACTCVLSSRKAGARNIEELGRVGRWWELVRVSHFRDVVLVVRARLRRHDGGLCATQPV